FGLSTNKTMRAERLTDLMNNLSGKKETKVTVTLYDEKNETQLVIARRIRLRNNGQYESTYFLDSKASTLSEIQDQLAMRSISPNAYNVVMQGDVTKIISMSPLERRRIIDELAGVAEFDRKIDDAKEEISQATYTLEQQTILLSEFSDRLEVLKKERDQAVKYVELKKNRNYLERFFRKARIKELEERKVKLENNIESKTTEKSEHITNLGEITKEFVELEGKSASLQEELNTLNIHERPAIQQQLDNARESHTKKVSGIEFLEKQISDYKKQAERLTKENKIGNKKIAEIDLQVKELEEKEAKLQKEMDAIQSEHDGIQAEIVKKSQSDNLSAGKVLEIQDQISELQNQKAALTTEKALSEQNLNRLKQEIEEQKEELGRILQELQKTDSLTSSSESQAFAQKVNTKNTYLRKLKEELNDTEQEVRDRTNQFHSYQQELSRLEMKKSVSEEHNWGRAVDLVLNSGVSGVHGVLAQLATVPSQYSQALEVAAGARLKSIVVETDKVGGQLIEFLRARKGGRATFLPLNKIKTPVYDSLPREAESPSSGIIGWAIDLVQCEDQFLPAFAYAFGTTVVVKDVQVGRRYLGRFRMVTLEGDLLEKGGAMTGGSSLKSSGIHFGQEDNAKVAHLTKQVQQVQQRLEILKRAMQDLKAEIAETEKELEVLRDEWARIKASEEVKGNNVQNLRNTATQLKKKLSDNAAERENLEIRTKELNKELASYDRQIKETSDYLAIEGARVKDSGLENLINRSQELEYERKRLEANYKNIDSSKSEYLKNIEVVKGTIIRSEDEISQAEDKVVELEAQIIDLQNQVELSAEKLVVLENSFKELLAKISEVEKSKTETSKALLKLTEEKTEITETIKRLNLELADQKTKLLDIEERLASLKQENLNSEIKELEEQDIDEELKRMVQNFSLEEVRKELDKIERKMTALEPVNMKAIEEYNEVFARLTEVKEKCEGLIAEKEEIEKRINSYSNHKLRSFFEAFDDVNKHFQEIFAELSFGHGELTLENKEDPFQGGLIIQARPRNKKMQRLESMSGGEKSLTALSFIFALQWHNPAPFYAFDEVDMFLDGLNAERLSKMVKKQSSLAQFIVVSLRKPMIKSSERAIGVFLGKDGFSKVAGMKNKEEALVASK
ncbi:MAG TPA: chromosome segregation protein SMC, partial [Vampirovibrionales bacterium]